MVTRKELTEYGHLENRPFRGQPGLGSATTWLAFYALAVVTAFFSNGAVVFLVYAAALALLAILPGVILMRSPIKPASINPA